MHNRLKPFLGPPADPPDPPDDYFEIESRFETFAVSPATAAAVEHALDRRPRPRWLTFHDLTGARHRVRANLVTRISECTAAQRAAGRAFHRARRREYKTDHRPWEDDD